MIPASQISRTLFHRSSFLFASNPKPPSSNSLATLGGLFGLILVSGGAYFYHRKDTPARPPKVVETLKDQNIEKMRELAIEKTEKQKEEILAMFEDVNDKMLRYRGDPTSETMLVDYTIYGDLHWYEVKPEYFTDPEESLILLNESEVEKRPIKKAKINERLTHALEAERVLQNIFVNVSDVLNEIEKTGRYTPPGIFMKYYGYVYFKIRNKPLNLENLVQAKETISLFDLFFRYQSPVLYYHREFSEIPIKPAQFDSSPWIPNAYLNTKATPRIYLTGKVKQVFAQRSKLNTLEDSRYKFAWTNHYQ